MELNQLVHASEVLENLEQIKNEIQINKKNLSKDGKTRIDEIIADCCEALSKTCECGDKGRKEFERINALILETCLDIKAIEESKTSILKVLA